MFPVFCSNLFYGDPSCAYREEEASNPDALVTVPQAILLTACLFNNRKVIQFACEKGWEALGQKWNKVDQLAHNVLRWIGPGTLLVTDLLPVPRLFDLPETVIKKSCKRIAKHDPVFADSIHFLCKEIVSLIEREGLLLSLQESTCLNSLIELNRDWIVATLQANLMHLIANLSDRTFAESETVMAQGEAGQEIIDPLGVLLSHFFAIVGKYQLRLSPTDQRSQRAAVFADMSKEVLETLFPKGKDDLILCHTVVPGMEIAKELIWGKIVEALPSLLEQFVEQMGEMTAIFLEKENNRQILNASGYSPACEAITALASDFHSHFFPSLRSFFNDHPQSAQGLLARFSEKQMRIFSHILTHTFVENEGVEQMIAALFAHFLEALSLRAAVAYSSAAPLDTDHLKQLIANARTAFLQTDDECQQKRLADDLSKAVCSSLQIENNLFAIPPTAKPEVLDLIIEKLGEIVFEYLSLDRQISSQTVPAIDNNQPLSAASESIIALTTFILNKVTDYLAADADGSVQGVAQLYSLIEAQLARLEQEREWKIVPLLRLFMSNRAFSPHLETLFQLLDVPTALLPNDYKERIVQWMGPLITNQAIHHLRQLLEKETREGKAFNQKLLLTLTPLLTEHFKNLSASGAQNIQADGDMRPNQELFYKAQAEILFDLALPLGVQNFNTIFPRLRLDEIQYADLRKAATDFIASHLPKALEVLFDKETLTFIFSVAFEEVIDTLKKPINRESAPPTAGPQLQQATEVENRIDQEVGELLLAAAHFLDFPAPLLNQVPLQKAGAAIRARFNGQFFAEVIPLALRSIQSKRHVRRTAQERLLQPAQDKQRLRELEEKMAKEAVSFFFQSLGAYLANASDVFTHPVLKACRHAAIAMTSFVCMTVIGGAFRILGMEWALSRFLGLMIDTKVERFVTSFSRVDLQEGFVFKSVEALESVLCEPIAATDAS